MAPRLPQELIDDIIDQAVLSSDDFVSFWGVGRRVCRQWSLQIAQKYAKLFLQTPGRCIIHFDLGWDSAVDERNIFSMEMVFDRFDLADSRRCIFTETEQTGPPYPASWQQDYIDAYERSKYSMWRQNLDMYMGVDLPEDERGRIDIPPYVLSIYGRPNDTELPDLKIDYEKREISFDWEGMFSKFCYEEAEFDRVVSARGEDFGQKWKPQIDEIAGPDAKAKKMMDAIAAFLDNTRAARKDVRRRRIIRYFKVHDDCDFEFHSEHEPLERAQLKRIDQAQGVGQDEDDDENDMEDDDMDDEDEEDEWTDEDGAEDEDDN